MFFVTFEIHKEFSLYGMHKKQKGRNKKINLNSSKCLNHFRKSIKSLSKNCASSTNLNAQTKNHSISKNHRHKLIHHSRHFQLLFIHVPNLFFYNIIRLKSFFIFSFPPPSLFQKQKKELFSSRERKSLKCNYTDNSMSAMLQCSNMHIK